MDIDVFLEYFIPNILSTNIIIYIFLYFEICGRINNEVLKTDEKKAIFK